MDDYKFKKIDVEEFDKLARLFPGTPDEWLKYRFVRLNQISNKEADVFVIDYNGIFIGEVSVNYISHVLKTETILNTRVYLEAFRVDKNFQGKGLGQKLLDFVMGYLVNLGYREATIGVEDDNMVAKHIYFKYGFTKAIDKGHGNEFDPCEYTLYLNDKI